MRIMIHALPCSLALWACKTAPEVLGGDDTGDDGTAGDGDTGDSGGVDEDRLDRSVDEGPCGYPGPGDNGYGTDVGKRVANTDGIEIIDCDGNELSLADFLCKRDDDYGDFNRAILLNIGAGWCAPCQEETRDDLPGIYADLRDQGLEILQVMFQDWNALAPTKEFCGEWRAGDWQGADIMLDEPLQFPILLDRTNDFRTIYMSDPQASTPVNVVMDANANIRFKTEGEKPAGLEQQIEQILASPYAP